MNKITIILIYLYSILIIKLPKSKTKKNKKKQFYSNSGLIMNCRRSVIIKKRANHYKSRTYEAVRCVYIRTRNTYSFFTQ